VFGFYVDGEARSGGDLSTTTTPPDTSASVWASERVMVAVSAIRVVGHRMDPADPTPVPSTGSGRMSAVVAFSAALGAHISA